MIRIIAKLFAVAVGFTVCLPVQPSSAENVAFVSATGSGGACTQTAPCGSINTAVSSLPNGGRVVCATPVVETVSFGFANSTYVFDCPGASMLGQIVYFGKSVVLKFQHMGFSNAGNVIGFQSGGGTLIFEDCVIEDAGGTALDIEPPVPFNLVVTNSRISTNAAGVLLKPAAGGSVTATFDRVTITGNSGGGVKTDTTNGPVSVDISNSTISNNGGNGMNAVSGAAGGVNMLNIKNSVIARNGSAGVQVNGANAAALINNTLLDSNGTGATTAINGGRVLTYGNNSIVGAPGSGFTASTPLQ
jgi:Right handed beta helix region